MSASARAGVPTDIMVVLAATTLSGEWFSADELRGRLRAFGFDLSRQKVVGLLRRSCALDSAPIECGGRCEYRVTSFGKTWLGNLNEGRLSGGYCWRCDGEGRGT
jgi:hypothetical protein